jgi:hypothetical protein
LIAKKLKILTHVSSKLSIAEDKSATDQEIIQTINFIIAKKNATNIAIIGAFFSIFVYGIKKLN